MASMTPLFWMVGMVDCLIAILCHASSRTLALYGVCAGGGGRSLRYWLLISSGRCGCGIRDSVGD